MLFILLLLLAYLAGSINMALWVSRLAGLPNPRKAYSRNPGATNVYRQAGLFWALAVVILEVAKAAVIAWAAYTWLPAYQVLWVGMALILGNRWPLFHHFRGGKGVANYLGFGLYLNPLAAFVGIALWAAGIYLTKHPFIGSFLLVTTLTVGIVISLGTAFATLLGAFLTLFLIIGLHHENITGFLEGRKKVK